MATRNDVQIAQDLVKFANNINNAIDITSYFLQEKEPETGQSATFVDEQGARKHTPGELKDLAIKHLEMALLYEQRINTFISSYGAVNVDAALNSIYNMSSTDFSSDVDSMGDEARYIIGQLGATTDLTGLAVLGQHIDQTVSKLVLVRRSWCLGIK